MTLPSCITIGSRRPYCLMSVASSSKASLDIVGKMAAVGWITYFWCESGVVVASVVGLLPLCCLSFGSSTVSRPSATSF